MAVFNRYIVELFKKFNLNQKKVFLCYRENNWLNYIHSLIKLKISSNSSLMACHHSVRFVTVNSAAAATVHFLWQYAGYC